MDMNNFDFEFAMPLEKSVGENGEWILKGVATGTGVDSQGERMAPKAIEGFVKQIERTPVPFLNWHNKNDALAEMGEVKRAWIEPNMDMGVEILLDQDHHGAQTLWNKLDKGKQFGMSVSGKVHDYKDEYEKSAKVRTFYDVTLDEISLTTKPIYTPSFGTVLRKAADMAADNEGDMGNETTPVVTEDTVTNESVETTVEVKETSSEQVVEPTTPAAEENPATEKSASTRTTVDASKLMRLAKKHPEVATLVIDMMLEEAETPNTDSTPSEPVASFKSEATQVGGDDRLEKALSETAELREEINRLRDLVPAVQAPGVIVKKSELDELDQMLKSMEPQDRLIFALRALHEGK